MIPNIAQRTEQMTRARKHRSRPADSVVEFFSLFILGWAVAFVMFLLHDFEFFKAIDRSVTDALMRDSARVQLASTSVDSTVKHPPRIVFIDVGEESCRAWAKSCTLGMMTPRDKLREIADAITDGSGPKLVVFDIEFAPLPSDSSNDEGLTSAILRLASKADVITLRPMVVDPHSSNSRDIGYRSILDRELAQKLSCERKTNERKTNVWFASPLIESDPDGVVRSVYAWDEILIEEAHKVGRLPGVGFLGAALLTSQCEVLRCYFDASNSVDSTPDARQTCHGKIQIADQLYFPTDAKPARRDRILFSLPYKIESADVDHPSVPSQFETIEAYKLAGRVKDTPTLLADSIVVVGGSYWSSGDHHVVPLNASMPGAMVHANAIRAYAMGRIVDEHFFSFPVKVVFIAAAAFIGAVFHFVGSWASTGLQPWRAFFFRFAITAAGIAVSVFVVTVVGIPWASRELVISGKAIGVLTPALAIALEGACEMFGQLRAQLHVLLNRAYFWMEK
jgi:CHASE2 domain-containing sensor protein